MALPAYHLFGVVTNTSGVPVNNATVGVYQAQTLTPVAIYSDVNLSVVKTNPFLASADGTWDCYLDTGQYIRLQVTAPGATIRDMDNIMVPI